MYIPSHQVHRRDIDYGPSFLVNLTQPDVPNASPPSPYLTKASGAAVFLPIVAFITVVLDIPCFAWHVSSRNLAASVLVGCVMIQNLLVFLNAVIWPTDDMSSWQLGEGFCDLAVKLDWAGSAATFASTLCIMRALASALDTNRSGGSVRWSTRWNWRQILILGLCVGFPVYMTVAAFIVQDRRYYIFAISGCTMAEWHSAASLVLCYIPPLLVVGAACFYALMTLIRLRRYKRDIASVLASAGSGLSTTRFVRLLLLALVVLMIYGPLFVYTMIQNEAYHLFSFDWSSVHDPGTFNTIILVQSYGHANLNCWIKVSIGFVVFACFGFGKDIKEVYRKCLISTGLGTCIAFSQSFYSSFSFGHRSSSSTKSGIGNYASPTTKESIGSGGTGRSSQCSSGHAQTGLGSRTALSLGSPTDLVQSTDFARETKLELPRATLALRTDDSRTRERSVTELAGLTALPTKTLEGCPEIVKCAHTTRGGFWQHLRAYVQTMGSHALPNFGSIRVWKPQMRADHDLQHSMEMKAAAQHFVNTEKPNSSEMEYSEIKRCHCGEYRAGKLL